LRNFRQAILNHKTRGNRGLKAWI